MLRVAFIKQDLCLKLQHLLSVSILFWVFFFQLQFFRWWSHQWAKGQHVIRNLKRHSDGTFTNDFSNHLDKIKAKDFIEWLASMKREKVRTSFLEKYDVT
uniref:Glucagon / GIP / secretin / VIP family domain-containing protein n=1 Tax=Kryptolebias marmoratus TaxID=37003 RepID=A0A3Q2ZX06_KRYMA